MATCPSCGEENPVRFRLCGFCGASLAEAMPPQEVRRTVTVLFSDLKGSTNLGEALDSEALREVMSRYFNEMRRVLERHGGTIEKFIGDAVMAVFGLPRLHEDDALRAVRAAAEMQAALQRLNAELQVRWGVTLENRTGVNTGEVVAGDPAAGQRLVTGDAVNVAARLEQAAPALGVLIGETTWRLVRDAVEVEATPPLWLKGKSEPFPAYRLLRVRGSVGWARRMDAPMVGREAELQQLLTTFQAVVSTRRPMLVTVLGESGVGKSRLIGELTRRLRRRARALHGRCLSYGEGITLWPLAELVRGVAKITDVDASGEAVRRLTALLPDEPGVVERLATAIGLMPGTFTMEDTFWAARRLFEGLASRRPLIVHFEDVHWAEPAFLDLVEGLVTADSEARILVVCTAREELLENRPGWSQVPDAQVIRLEPLSSRDSVAVVTHLLGAEAPRELEEPITRAAEGNPLFVEQLVSMLLEEGRLVRKGARWKLIGARGALAMPATISALLTARIDRLGATERGAVERGAVIGQVFYRGALEALSPEGVRSAVPVALSSLVGKRLLDPTTEAFATEETYRFRHVLIRDAAYAGILKRARSELHAAFVDWLEDAAAGRLTEFEEIIGYHLEQAHRYRLELGPLDDVGRRLGPRAGAVLASAGHRAFARGDMLAASNLLSRATALIPEQSERVALLADLAEALLDLGELSRGEEVATEAIALAEHLGDRRLAANAILVRLLVRYVTDSEGWSEEVVREAERQIPVLEEADDHAGLARAWRLLGSVHGTACRYAEAERAVANAIQHARLAGDRRQEMRNLPAYAMSALYGPMPVEEAIARCRRILDEAPGDLRTEGIVMCTLAQLSAMAGRFDEARALYAEGRQRFRDLGSRLLEASTSLDSGRAELLAGDPEAALRELSPDYEALDAMGERYLRSTIAGLIARAEEALGRYVDADRFAGICEATAADADIESQALWRGIRARLEARGGAYERAEALAREAVELTRRTDGLGLQADALRDLAWVLSAGERTAEAPIRAAEAVEAYERKGNVVAATAARRLQEAGAELAAAPTPT